MNKLIDQIKGFIKKYGLIITGIITGIFISNKFRKKYKIKTSDDLRKKYKNGNKEIDKFKEERKKQYEKLGRLTTKQLNDYISNQLSKLRKNSKK